MAELDLDELLAEDLTVTYRGVAYVIPGDISVPDAFRLVRYRNAVGASSTIAAQEKNLVEAGAFLLDLLRISTPDLEKLPFGVFGMTRVIEQYLAHIGLEVTPPSDDPADPDNEAHPTTAAPSASSTGSPRSARSSAGSRKRGAASPSPS